LCSSAMHLGQGPSRVLRQACRVQRVSRPRHVVLFDLYLNTKLN
jgi:hypothetical protein